jgi:hypothetical protein
MIIRRSSILHSYPKLTLVAAVAVVLAAGCNRQEQESNAPPSSAVSPPAPTAPAVAPPEHVALTGCLQKGNGGAYILTELNEPAQLDSSKPAVVAREKLAAAEAAYRLSSTDRRTLSHLVGRRVHVEGDLTKASDLVANATNRGQSIGTSGQSGEIRAIESGRVIRQADLAQVNVASIEKVANTCGHQAARRPR